MDRCCRNQALTALAPEAEFVNLFPMKFLLAIVAYMVIGIILCLGMYLGMAKGSWWFLIAGVVAYVVAFARIGCLPSKSH